MDRLFLLIACLTASCAKDRIVTVTKEVKVPVLYCPAPPELTRPGLPIFSITDSDSDADVALKYEASIILLESYSHQLEAIIENYRKLSKESKAPLKPL